MRAARRAGRYDKTIATARIVNGTLTNTIGSNTLISYS